MEFNTENQVVRLCAEGMEFEGKGENGKASEKFEEAWNFSQNDFDKFTSAHYVARHQKSIIEKLNWDKTALDFALKISDKIVKGSLPSLYLNIGKCHEDLNDFVNARANYVSGKSYFEYLPTDGYGNMIKKVLKVELNELIKMNSERNN
ncbi:MAG: rRNA adenine methyltransferase [Saprospiraceae bacterium]|nr:rRNA adenine methyltransferase [Saprospiraceae bacterium]